MTKYKIIFTERARSDICDIGDYIANILLAPDTAENLISSLLQKISFLKIFPNIYPVIDSYTELNKKIHCMPYKNYYVFYKVLYAENTVIILRVGYNRRNWSDILK